MLRRLPMTDSTPTPHCCAGDVSEEPGPQPAPRNWRALFLEHLAETSNVTRSARHAGIAPGKAYHARRIEPEFARQWQAALADGYAHLEMELLRRLREGDFKTADNERYDIANAIRLLASRRECHAAPGNRAPDVSAADVRASIDRKIADIRRRMNQDRHDDTQAS